jgi:hypothetical protein
MREKLGELFNSVRFWQVTLGTIFVILGHYVPNLEFLWNTLAGYLGIVIGIGTLDSVAQKLGSKKK